MLNRCWTKTAVNKKSVVLHIRCCGYAGRFPQRSLFWGGSGVLDSGSDSCFQCVQGTFLVLDAPFASRSSCRPGRSRVAPAFELEQMSAVQIDERWRHRCRRACHSGVLLFFVDQRRVRIVLASPRSARPRFDTFPSLVNLDRKKG